MAGDGLLCPLQGFLPVPPLGNTTSQAREKKIYELWLACHTQEEIAEDVGLPRQTVTDFLSELPNSAKLPNSALMAASRADLDQLPIYNVWKQKQYASDKKHFGNTCKVAQKTFRR